MSLCSAMRVSRSAYYAWRARPAEVITAEQLHLYRRTKALFKASRQSLGSRQMMNKLRKEGFDIGRYRTRSVMRRLGLLVKQRRAYKVTTQQKKGDRIADNLLDQQFNPSQLNVAWAGDVTYLRTHEGWMYLAVVMDLAGRRIVGWALHKRMTVALVERAMQMAINLRSPPKGLLFHSDRGSQYTSRRFASLLEKREIRASMSGKGACWDNAVVERFFGSLKNEWLLNVYHLTHQSMQRDVEQYIRYYNHDRLHTANGGMAPVEFELSQMKVSGWT